ncbi:hypothetical protein BgiBS90_015452, partial [Biomphalaria glabrata]
YNRYFERQRRLYHYGNTADFNGGPIELRSSLPFDELDSFCHPGFLGTRVIWPASQS